MLNERLNHNIVGLTKRGKHTKLISLLCTLRGMSYSF